jgi:hypothetical protein
VQNAGLCHAFYGTDRFAPSLLDLRERDVLIRAVGSDVEAIVYLYAGCDRAEVYPRIGRPGSLNFTDRFTGTTRPLDAPEVRAFMEITAANELDIVTHSTQLASSSGPALFRLFSRGRELLSPSAWAACQATLGPGQRTSPLGR